MKKLLCAAVALICLPAAAANAATIFSNDFSSALTANESVYGIFGLSQGGVGTPGYYWDYSSGGYRLEVDLTGYENVQLSFDRTQMTEGGYDYVYSNISNGSMSQNLFFDSGYYVGPMSFDISQYANAGLFNFSVDFYTDYSVTWYGVTIDNVRITGDLIDQVPEPAALGLLGLGLLALGARRRKRG